MKTDEVRRSMFRMGLVHTRDNGPEVSSAELEHTAKYWDLLYVRTGIEYCRSHRNRSRVFAYSAGINRSRGANTPHRIPGGHQVIPQVCGHAWLDKTTINITLQDPLVFPEPGASCLIIILCNYQFMGIAWAEHDQEFKKTWVHV